MGRNITNPQILALRAKVTELEAQLKTQSNPTKEMKELAEVIRIIQRAVKGESVDDNNFMGLIDIEDIRERTRLDEATLLSHSAMRVIGKELKELSFFETIADMEDPYYISLDGLGRQEAISTVQAKTRLDTQNVINMSGQNQNPQDQQQTAPSQPKKRGFLSRFNPFKR